LLLADFKTNLQHPGNGLVIDSYLHSRTGSRVTELLIRGGRVQEKDNIFLNGKFGKAKMLYDLHSNKITSASAGDIIQVVGVTFPTELGDGFLVVNNEDTKEIIEKQLVNYLEKKDKLTPPSITKEKKNINLILLADSQNTLEALSDLVRKKDSSDCRFSVVYTAIGNLNNFAIDLAKITQSIVLSFGLQLSQEQTKIFKGDSIPFFSSKIIYEIEDKLVEIISSQQETEEVEEIVGKARVEKSFYFSKVGNIAGCQVVSGKISRNNRVHV
jgi:translation initiation factor IF-2